MLVVVPPAHPDIQSVTAPLALYLWTIDGQSVLAPPAVYS